MPSFSTLYSCVFLCLSLGPLTSSSISPSPSCVSPTLISQTQYVPLLLSSSNSISIPLPLSLPLSLPVSPSSSPFPCHPLRFSLFLYPSVSVSLYISVSPLISIATSLPLRFRCTSLHCAETVYCGTKYGELELKGRSRGRKDRMRSKNEIDRGRYSVDGVPILISSAAPSVI